MEIESGTVNTIDEPGPGLSSRWTSPRSRETVSKTTERPIPRPDSSLTTLDVEKPGWKIRRDSSSADEPAASASESRPRRTATSATRARSIPRPSSSTTMLRRLPGASIRSATRPTAPLPRRRALVGRLDPVDDGVAERCASAGP